MDEQISTSCAPASLLLPPESLACTKSESDPEIDPAWRHLGLECAGVVRSVGTGVRRDLIGKRVMAVARGCFASHVAVPADLPALLRDTNVVLIDGHYPALAVAAARTARAAEIPVVLDGGSSKPVYAELVPLADAMVCSSSFGGLPERFDAVAAELLAAGVRLVAMTAGGAPVRWRTRDATGVVEVPPVTVCDTLGAGDVLHGAFAFARALGVPDPERSLGFGVAVASLRVQHVGPRSWRGDRRLPGLVV